MELNEIKAEIAGILARLLSRPDESLVAALNSGAVARALKPHTGEQDEILKFLNASYTLADLIAMYDEAMGPSSAKRFLPVESLFKKWCDDTEYTGTGHTAKGLLMGDPAMHMIELYSQCGIGLPAEFGGQPDHLTLELEFLSILYEKCPDEMVLRFITDHLDWMPELLKKWRELQVCGFYIRAAEAVEAFLGNEISRLSRKQEVNA
jgi:putative dimethyl sulfoxide reductase chaperone